MKDLILVKHASGAPGLRLFGLGPNFSPQRGAIQLKFLLGRNTLWAQNRSLQDIKKMLSNSVAIVSVWQNNQMVGFGRATSDEVYRAVLWDIVVDKKHQKNGLGKIIVDTILKNKLISKAERIYLMTTSCEKFYSKMGFLPEKEQTLMMKTSNY